MCVRVLFSLFILFELDINIDFEAKATVVADNFRRDGLDTSKTRQETLNLVLTLVLFLSEIALLLLYHRCLDET